jgi:hypothetical protein
MNFLYKLSINAFGVIVVDAASSLFDEKKKGAEDFISYL